MKNKFLPLFILGLMITLFSCQNTETIDLNDLENAEIIIDANSQINLAPTTLSKSEIEELSCGESMEVTLTAGQHIDVGTVTVSNDNDNLYVTYEVSGDWYLTETHLFVGMESDIPLTRSGNPQIGHFPYHASGDSLGDGKSYTFTIPMEDLDECFAVVAHAVVIKIVDGEMVQEETAFGCGDKSFPGNRWGCYFEYCKQDCEEECMDAFAYKNERYSFCFLDYGFDRWGWTNKFTFEELYNYQIQYEGNYQFPLYAGAVDCDLTVADEIGYIEMEVYYEGEELKVNVKYVLTDADYNLSDMHLYIADQYLFPFDGSGESTINTDYYTYHQNDDGTSEYVFSGLDWPSRYNHRVYVIAYAVVCPS